MSEEQREIVIDEVDNGEEVVEDHGIGDEQEVEGTAETGEHADHIPDAEEQEKDANWLKNLRKNYREEKRRSRELEDRLRSLESASIQPKELGKEPEIEDFDYDTDKFKAAWKDWNIRRTEVESAAKRVKDEEDAKANEWKSTLENYEKQKIAVQADDMDDAEDAVKSILNTTQQGIILHAADNPASIVLEIGRNERKAIELASITDPIKFAAAIAKLEERMKTTTTRKAPAPEKRAPEAGGARPSGTSAGNADKLLEEAQKTGDMTKYRAYMRQQREKSS
jgi:hypothetical protein